MLDKDTIQDLIEKAFKAREAAYVPYSNFGVGAALLTENGKVYTGCNIENASFSPTICAERVALFKAVSEGVRGFRAIAVVGGKVGQTEFDFCPPCGVCRQALSEFCAGSFEVITAKSKDEYRVTPLAELLPQSFSLL